MARLSELMEADAPPEKKAIYAEVRACCRTPMVALIYRHLGSLDGVLEWAWGALGPAMRSGVLPAAAAEVADATPQLDVTPYDAAAVAAFDLRQMDRDAIRYVIGGYHAANPCNILAVLTLHALLAEPEGHGTPAPLPVPGATVPGQVLPPLPPMVAPADLPPAVDLLRPKKAGEVGLVPSLYRHLAHWPAWLSDAAESRIAPLYAAGEIDRAGSALRSLADERAAIMAAEARAHDGAAGRPVGADREKLRDTLAAFVETIPAFIVVGQVLKRTLPNP
ncbi:MAG: hypothetical protein OXR84_02145 [Magnetovibrio sp.]|nr:hypothetical protein [Magnetovibrio sp.]